jgi:predicted ABC-type ATPase
MPRCLIIAGPNGAGKTTFALRYLRDQGITHFLNVDMIAAGLSPLRPEAQAAEAARLFFARLKSQIQLGEDFAFETTLSGKAYLKHIERMRASGWNIELIYLALPSVEMSKLRVAERVRHGGHNIPLKDIERRFPRSLRNLFVDYCRVVDYCICLVYLDDAHHMVFERNSSYIRIGNADFYEKLLIYAGLHGQ